MTRWIIGGIEVTLWSLHQDLVYAGMLEGLPTRERNADYVARLRERHPAAHLVAPEETPIDYRGVYPFGTPAALPDVQCVAHFHGPGRTELGLYRTDLTVIWFQASWALPVAASVEVALRELDWGTLAFESEV